MLIKHLEHLEDLIYNKKDFTQCMSVLTKLNGLLFSQSNKITTKSDGCISIVFGIHPLSKQFFISTKSAFNKNAILCYTYSDIEKYFTRFVSENLGVCFKLLKNIVKTDGVYQADIFYTLLTKQYTDNGEILFTPNLITYHIDKNHEDYDKIDNSVLGVAVHTKYTGIPVSENSLEGMIPNVIDAYTEFNQTNLIYFINTSIKKYIKRYQVIYIDTEVIFDDDEFELLTKHKDLLKQFYNFSLKENISFEEKSFGTFIKHKIDKDLKKLKTDKSKQKCAQNYIDILLDFTLNKTVLQKYIGKYKSIQSTKNHMIDYLDSCEHHYDFQINGKESGPEGYIFEHNDYTIKLVNREIFSKLNFEKHSKKDKNND